MPKQEWCAFDYNEKKVIALPEKLKKILIV